MPHVIVAYLRLQTVYANNITFLRWIVDNGDDSISMKQNSTNIYIANCTFHNGLSFAMGSIGQYPGQINVIENVTAEDIILHNTVWGGRVKTVRASRPHVARLLTKSSPVDRRQYWISAKWRW